MILGSLPPDQLETELSQSEELLSDIVTLISNKLPSVSHHREREISPVQLGQVGLSLNCRQPFYSLYIILQVVCFADSTAAVVHTLDREFTELEKYVNITHSYRTP